MTSPLPSPPVRFVLMLLYTHWLCFKTRLQSPKDIQNKQRIISQDILFSFFLSQCEDEGVQDGSDVTTQAPAPVALTLGKQH